MFVNVGLVHTSPRGRKAHRYSTNISGIPSAVLFCQQSGKIVNIGSISGWHASPWGGCYCASKAALHSVTNSLRMEVKPLGLQVMLVFPGAIK